MEGTPISRFQTSKWDRTRLRTVKWDSTRFRTSKWDRTRLRTSKWDSAGFRTAKWDSTRLRTVNETTKVRTSKGDNTKYSFRSLCHNEISWQSIYLELLLVNKADCHHWESAIKGKVILGTQQDLIKKSFSVSKDKAAFFSLFLFKKTNFLPSCSYYGLSNYTKRLITVQINKLIAVFYVNFHINI